MSGPGELYIGLLSGTSIDSIDALLVDFDHPPLRLIQHHSHQIPPDLKEELEEVIRDQRVELPQLLRLDHRFGALLAAAVQTLLLKAQIPASRIRAIGSHGQTICHHPHAPFPSTLQIGDPNLLAERTGIEVVADIRRRDIACGGQGAPLVPAFHEAVFRQPGVHRVIINIGGIANLSILPGDDGEVSGFDTGPGNTLMDRWALTHLGQPLDRDGAWASEGTPDQRLLQRLLDDDYLRLPPPKSTGREHFNLAWLAKRVQDQGKLRPVDIQATLAELTASTIATAVQRHCPLAQEAYVCGGGAHNRHLHMRLQSHLGPVALDSTAALGISPDWVEAAAFAWLAMRAQRGEAGNAPSVTGAAGPRILGARYPGQSGWQ